LEIPGQQVNPCPQRIQGRVAWVRKSRGLRGVFQVGLELESPGNVWNLASPPEDWQQLAAPGEPDAPALEREMQQLLLLAESGTYYELLHVTSQLPRSQIKHNYYELVRKFHPDRHMDQPEWTQSLHKLMDTITLAYKTLTDEPARKKYDKRLAASGTFALGRHRSEKQQTAEECLEKARECFRAQNYGGSILWLRKAVYLEPGSTKYRALLARALSAMPQYRHEAIQHYQQVIELDPLNTAAHFQLAQLYEEMKLPWRARPHYQRILEIDPENSKSSERLRLLDAQAGKAGTRKRTLTERIFSHPRK
jgi:curved DNA-binding protein CbpA